MTDQFAEGYRTAMEMAVRCLDHAAALYRAGRLETVAEAMEAQAKIFRAAHGATIAPVQP